MRLVPFSYFLHLLKRQAERIAKLASLAEPRRVPRPRIFPDGDGMAGEARLGKVRRGVTAE
jgi:hypothetical protein